MNDDEYALIPQHEVEELKKEVEDLKKNPLAGTASGNDLLHSVAALNASINSMLDLFKSASEQMKGEGEQGPGDQFKPILDKLDEIVDQNKKIAKGIVAIADMVREGAPKEEAEEPEPVAPPVAAPPAMPPPVAPPESFPPPPGEMPPPMSAEPLPPPGAPPAMPPEPAMPPMGGPMPPPEAPPGLPPLGPPPGPPGGEKKGMFGGLLGKK